jgi:ribosomal protein S27AE
MPETKKMKCPDCGIDLNHHADKIDYSSGRETMETADVELGGVIEEVHACPECGRTETRMAR